MHRLDDLDVRIIKELGSPSSPQWNVRETYSSIAKRIGVDEETVRRRLKRAEEQGSLPGWRMMVNPHLIGCEAACLDLEVNDEQKKDRAIAEIRRVDGVVKILDFRGKRIADNAVLPEHGLSETKDWSSLASICDSSEPTVWELSLSAFRRSDDEDRLEDSGDDALGPKEEPRSVSKSVGVSVRTVERRMAAMTDGRVVYLQGTPNFKVFVGLSCVLLVFCPDAKKKSVVDRAVLSKVQRTELANTSSKQYSTFVILFDNLSEADDAVHWATGLDGVKNVKMGIMRGLIVVQDWLRDEVVKRVTNS